MDRPKGVAYLLLVVGLASGIGMLAALGLPLTLPGRIAIGIGSLASAVFLLTGGAWLFEYDTDTVSHAHIPALGLVLMGVVGIGWSALEFEPWRVYGSDVVVLDLPLRRGLVGFSILVGVGFIAAGWRWFKARQLRYPLAIFSFGLSLALMHLTHVALDALLPPIPTPVLGLLLLIAIVPAVVVIYKLPFGQWDAA